MNVIRLLGLGTLTLSIAVLLGMDTAEARAEHSEWAFEVLDYNDCTGEDVLWKANIYETLQYNESASGRVVLHDLWRFQGTVEGQATGYIWAVKGISSYRENYGLDGQLTGGWALVEKAPMRPMTPGAPDIMLDVNMKFAYNALGELVVERTDYNYFCRN